MAITFSTKAQVNISINIGSQPAWGPTGYDHVDYYYLPDIDCYYDVPNKVYVYHNGNSWVRSRDLPSKYKSFDFYNVHKVVINGMDKPYEHNDKYRQEYGGFKGKQNMIRCLSVTARKRSILRARGIRSMHSGQKIILSKRKEIIAGRVGMVITIIVQARAAGNN